MIRLRTVANRPFSRALRALPCATLSVVDAIGRPTSAYKKMKYLVVDDHALVTTALSMLLQTRDPEAEVHTAANAAEALALIDEHGESTDLLILDLSLPDVKGTELMEEIVNRMPMLKILVLSGLVDQQSIMRVLQLGAAGFVPKSLDTDMLETAIDFVMKGGVYIPTKTNGPAFSRRPSSTSPAPTRNPCISRNVRRTCSIFSPRARPSSASAANSISRKAPSRPTSRPSTAPSGPRTAPKRSSPRAERASTSSSDLRLGHKKWFTPVHDGKAKKGEADDQSPVAPSRICSDVMPKRRSRPWNQSIAASRCASS